MNDFIRFLDNALIVTLIALAGVGGIVTCITVFALIKTILATG